MALDRISEKNLIKGYKHLVKHNDYLGGRVGFLERRITVAQVLEEMSFGMTPEQISESYDLSIEAVKEALSFAQHVTENPNVGLGVEDAS